MNELLKNLLQSGLSSNALEQMSQRSGLDSSSISSIIAQVAPALVQKANDNFKGDQDSTPLVDMINKTSWEDADGGALDVDKGNEMLGQLTGSKEESRSLANSVGDSLGIDAASITKLLPMIAPFALGMLNKQVGSSSLSSGSDTGSITSMLTSFIDKDNDGSVVDDLLGMAGKFFRS